MQKRSGRKSNRIIDMRPGHSGDPFFEAQRRLNENENLRRFDARLDQGKRRISKMNLQDLFDRMAPSGIDMQGPLFHRQPLKNVSNPFQKLNEFIMGDQGRLIPIGRPWLEDGAMTVPVTGFDWGTFKTESTPQETNLRSIQEPVKQRSLTAQKKGRIKQRP